MKRLGWLILFNPGTVCAEVMDKESSLLTIWSWTFIGAGLLFLVARFRPWLLLLVAPLPALFFYGQLSEVTDPFVKSAMLREAGFAYIASSWATPVVTFSGAIVGLWVRKT